MEVSVELSVEVSVEVSIEVSVEVSGEASVEVSVEFSVEVSVEVSIEVSVVVSIEISVEVSIEVSVEVSMEVLTFACVENLMTATLVRLVLRFSIRDLTNWVILTKFSLPTLPLSSRMITRSVFISHPGITDQVGRFSYTLSE